MAETDIAPQAKRCHTCRAEKQPGDFNAHRQKKDGLHPNCKTCERARLAAKRASDPQTEARRARKSAYDKARYYRDPEATRAKTRIQYERDPDRVKRNAAKWNAENRDRRRLICQSYKHRRRSVERAGMTWRELEAWKQAQAKRCYWCDTACARGFVVDHYEPLSKGGKHEAGNLVISCRACNARKAARDPLDFAQSIGRLL